MCVVRFTREERICRVRIKILAVFGGELPVGSNLSLSLSGSSYSAWSFSKRQLDCELRSGTFGGGELSLHPGFVCLNADFLWRLKPELLKSNR